MKTSVLGYCMYTMTSADKVFIRTPLLHLSSYKKLMNSNVSEWRKNNKKLSYFTLILTAQKSPCSWWQLNISSILNLKVGRRLSWYYSYYFVCQVFGTHSALQFVAIREKLVNLSNFHSEMLTPVDSLEVLVLVDNRTDTLSRLVRECLAFKTSLMLSLSSSLLCSLQGILYLKHNIA